jgi:glycine/D-amino acid oxidase-like deaminating enzyme/CRP-like cAMP-binding protein
MKRARIQRGGAKRVTIAEVRNLIRRAERVSDNGGYELFRRELRRIDQDSQFSPGSWALFQDLLAKFGMSTSRPIGLPRDDQPFWSRSGNPLAGFRSHLRLPEIADVVVIGAGLTGASAAYHLASAVSDRKWRVAVLDQGDPAGEASGRNGGNFELIPENALGAYEGLAAVRFAFLQRQFPRMPSEVLLAVSERQASLVLGLALQNRNLMKGIILREGLSCDFSPKGWLYLSASEEEEQGICEEVSLAAQHGQRIEIWSRRKIREEFGFETDFLGRFIPGDGTYHPLKYVCGVLKVAIDAGVELYARVKVRRVRSTGPARHLVETPEGTIVARQVIVATNAFTREVFPELQQIRPYQSQIMVTEGAPDRVRGRIVTSERGPVFFNQPREGAGSGRASLLLGGGDDRPMKNPFSRRRSRAIHDQLLSLRDQFYPELRGRPPSSEWTGPMGFTPDELPCIGFLREGVVVAAGFNGYGGSYTTAAGFAAAEMVTSGTAPEWVPEDIFSPRRLLSSDPFFMSQRDSLWRIALSLCRQLNLVNAQISEAISLNRGSRSPTMQASAAGSHSARQGITAAIVGPDLISELPTFADFDKTEIESLVSMMRGWRCSSGARLFTEGELGGSCFVVAKGNINVTLHVRGEGELLAQLPPGSIFGQVSLITGEPRNATCTASSDSLLLELEHQPCQQLLNGRSRLALKFLAALNQGLIHALRGADRRLMQINTKGSALEIHNAAIDPVLRVSSVASERDDMKVPMRLRNEVRRTRKQGSTSQNA